MSNLVVSLLGLPGSGKSTTAKGLSQKLGATVLHPGKFAFRAGLTPDKFPSREELVKLGSRLSGAFVEQVDQDLSGGPVILDGFPRTIMQAQELHETAPVKGWDMKYFELMFPPRQENELSRQRQCQRLQEDGIAINQRKLDEQMKFASTYDQPTIIYLKGLGYNVQQILALWTAEQVQDAILSVLGLRA